METINFIELDDYGKVAFRKSGSGPVLVLLHGFPENSGLWNEVSGALAQKMTVVAPDLPGAGGTTRPAGELTMTYMAGMVNELLNELGIDKVILAGHSMGGYVALEMASDYGDRIEGLSLIHSIASADDDEKKETRRKSIELIKKGGKDVFIRQMIPNLFSEQFNKEQKERLQEQVARGMSLEDESIISFYTAMINRADHTNVLENSAFPVQWIIGKEDKTIPPAKALQQTTLSDVTFVSVYKNSAHMSMLEQPQKLVEDLIMFTSYCNND